MQKCLTGNTKRQMRKNILTAILLLLSAVVFAGEIKLSGIYQGKNIYVMNPFAAAGVGFCVFEVKVNDRVTTDEINSSAFEIDLSIYQFNIGDRVSVEIKSKGGCSPKVLNAEVLKPTSTFSASALRVSKEGVLTWTTTGESGSLPFTVEQFRWNKWIAIATVDGIGTPGSNSYQVQVSPHAGENVFRVKQVDYTKQPRYSRETKFRSMSPPVTYSPQKSVAGEILFSSETMYEIYNPFGNLILKGIGTKVDVSGLQKLDKYNYILHFDNQVVQFNKK
jgi:hypothetical protein